MGEFICSSLLPHLSPEERIDLEAPLLPKELESIMSALPGYKAPGPDGLSNELFTLCAAELAAPLCDAFREARASARLDPSFLQADISFILKKDKDPKVRSSYRPIALINSDLKILARALAICLTPLANRVVHPDQAAFLPNRGVGDNLALMSLILYGCSASSVSEAICLFDIAKAFDSISWQFLWAILTAYGVGPVFVSWVKL